jgi:protein-disulfide isomerase
VFATVGDEKITMAEIRARSGDQLDALETQYQLAKSKILRSSLDSILQDKTLGAEAKKAGKSVDELVAAEAGPAGFNPSNDEIVAWFKDNQDRLAGRTLEQVRSQIVDLLQKEHRKAAEQKLEDRLRAERRVAVTYEPFRLRFDNEKAPTRGKNDAPITLVEFSDFQCPYCQRMAPTLKQVAEKFPNEVRIIYRQFPITNLHPFAFKAAEASLCANEQGKFWELHDTMFSDQTKLSVSELKEDARRLGMDQKKFNACLDSGRYVEQVQNDSKEAQRSGVTGTPAVFLNGVMVDGGAVSFSVLDAAIKKALAGKTSGS